MTGGGNPVKLRKRAPFWCRAKDLAGKFIHLDYALTETDGDLCPPHAAEYAEVKRRFFETPIRPPKAPESQAEDVVPIWPE